MDFHRKKMLLFKIAPCFKLPPDIDINRIFYRVNTYKIEERSDDIHFAREGSFSEVPVTLFSGSLGNPNLKQIPGRIEITKAQRITLPSLTPNDGLFRKLECFNKQNEAIAFTLFHNQISGLYQIEAEEDGYCDFTIAYNKQQSYQPQVRPNFSVDPNLISPLHSYLSSAENYRNLVQRCNELKVTYTQEVLINTLMQHLQNFAVAKDVPEEKTQYETLKALFLAGQGSCRHRACCAAMILSALGIKVRLVQNGIHAFIEVQSEEGEWQGYHMGGNPNAQVHMQQPKYGLPIADKSAPANKPAPASTTSPATALPAGPPVPAEIREKDLLEAFCPWKKTKELAATEEALFQVLATEQHNPLLLTEETDRLNAAIMKMLAHSGIDFIYIDSAAELHEKLRDIAITDGRKEDILGELGHFLAKDDQQPRVLLINWNNFCTEELASYQSIYNAFHRTVEDIPVNKNVKVVGYLGHKYSESGADFQSRQEVVYRVSGSIERGDKTLTDDSSSPKITPKKVKIDLYGRKDFNFLIYRMLLGFNGIEINEGEILTAIRKGATQIVFINPPDTREFNCFYQQLLHRKKLFYNGREIELPQELKIATETRGYDLASYRVNILKNSKSEELYYILNRATYHSYFNSFRVTADWGVPGAVETTAGIIANHQNGQLVIELTEELTEGEWAQFLGCCQQYNVTPQIHGYGNISLPPGLKRDEATAPQKASPIESQTMIIESPNPGITAQELLEREKGAVIATLSSSMGGGMVLANAEVKSQAGKAALLQLNLADILSLLLDENNTVILRVEGCLNQLLCKQLEPLFSKDPYLWLNGTRIAIKGKLILVTPPGTPQPVSYCRISQHKQEDIAPAEPLQEAIRLQFNVGGDDEMIRQFEGVLGQNRCVNLTGETGAGKSHFMQHTLPENCADSITIYNSMENLTAWAVDKSQKVKIIFIDESNLQGNLNSLAGIYDKTPTVLIDGKIHNLTPGHRIVFAGNPESYGERQAINFVERNAAKIDLLPMSKEFINSEIIQPLLTKLKILKHYENITQIIDRYHALLKETGIDLPYTARDAVSICLRIKNLLAAGFELTSNQIVLVCHLETQGKLTPADKNRLETILRETGLDIIAEQNIILQRFLTADSYTTKRHKRIKFSFTESHKHALYELWNLLQIRELRNNEKLASYEGKRGLLLEGQSGIGKSALVKYLLKQEGYIDCTDDLNIKTDGIDLRHEKKTAAKAAGKIFYQITAGNNGDEIARILETAFHAGAIVIVDEINLLRKAEKRLNSMLQGKGQNGRMPEKKGFTVIATQNPPTFGGRITQSLAFTNRLNKLITEEPADRNELIKTAQDKGLPQDDAELLAVQYLQEKQYAEEHKKDPKPNLRDFIKEVERQVKAQRSELKLFITTNIDQNHAELFTEPVMHQIATRCLNLFVTDGNKLQTCDLIEFWQEVQSEILNSVPPGDNVAELRRKLFEYCYMIAFSFDHKDNVVELYQEHRKKIEQLSFKLKDRQAKKDIENIAEVVKEIKSCATESMPATLTLEVAVAQMFATHPELGKLGLNTELLELGKSGFNTQISELAECLLAQSQYANPPATTKFTWGAHTCFWQKPAADDPQCAVDRVMVPTA
ncbi:MAG: ATP-binding protein [Gammaproteobacteria bacterium]|nr:ATP-binding protein [Gammaproteobacteria bacterium]